MRARKPRAQNRSLWAINEASSTKLFLPAQLSRKKGGFRRCLLVKGRCFVYHLGNSWRGGLVLTRSTFLFDGLATQAVTLTGRTTHYFAGSSYLKTFGDRFFGLLHSECSRLSAYSQSRGSASFMIQQISEGSSGVA